MVLTKDRVGALLFLAFSIAYGLAAQDIPLFPGDELEPFNSQTMPKALAWVGALAAFGLLIQPPKAGEGPVQDAFMGLNWTIILQLSVLMVLYGIGLKWIGFLISTTLFLIAGFYVLGERRLNIILLSSVPMVVIFWLVLTKMLGIYLTPGELYLDWTGGY